MSEFGDRINELPRASTGANQGPVSIYNPVNDRTEQIKIQESLGAIRASMDYQSDVTYADGDYVLFQGLTAWESLVNGNLGNIPAENSFWTQVTISPADGITITPHQNGLFTYDNSVVTNNNSIYFLNVAAPYFSSDFSAELIAGDWAIIPASAQPYFEAIPQSTPPSHNEARFFYDDVKKNFVFYNDRADVYMDVGRELWVRSINKTGTGATNGRPVYISGASGNLPEVMFAQANSINTSAVLAVFTEDVAIDDNGEATTFGLVNNVDTSSWAAGTQLYLSESSPGALTSTKPLPPNIVIPVATVIKQDASTGIILVKIGDPQPSVFIPINADWSAFTGSLTATNWVKGFYTFNTAVTPSGGGTAIANANAAHAAHVYIVLGAASTDMVLRFSGTSIADDGTRTPADTQDIDTSGGVLDDYFETSKKWIGQVSMTLLSGTGVSVNYGLAKYWDNRNSRFVVSSFEWTGRAGANDTAPNIRLFHHKATGWTYGAGGATPPTAIADMQATYVTEYQFINGRHFAFKRTGIDVVVAGEGSEGILIGIDITANNAVANSNIEVQIIGSE